MSQLSERAWTSIIQGHVLGERWQLALSAYQEMQVSRVHPSTFTFVALLKACSKLRNVNAGKQLHTQIAHYGCDIDLHVGRMLMGMYVKCGSLPEARLAFDKLPLRNVVSWNSLIAGYAEFGPREHAITCFEDMQAAGIAPNSVTMASVIKVCGASGAFDKGREIHRMMLAQNDSELGLSVANTLIGMYAKCGSLFEAQEVFDKLRVRDVVSWTALMAGYAEHGPAETALKCLLEMQQGDILPNEVTFSCVLKACGSIGDLEEGQRIHADIIKEEYETDATLGNSLISVYAKCGFLTEAHEVFEHLNVQDVASWTALISGYAEHGSGLEALEVFENMQQEGIFPDAVAYACSLKACSSIGAIDKGLQLHAEIAEEGYEGDFTINNTLIGMYGKLNLLSEAEDIFYMLPERNVISWTALIAGYSEHAHGHAVLSSFERMQLEGVSPNDVTYCCVLKACSNIGALDKGVKVHQEIIEKGLHTDNSIGTTLVSMYAKCGSLSRAREIFGKLSFQDTTPWTAMVTGYAEHGSDHEALNWFEQMRRERVCPNAITFVCALKACGSIGILVKSRELHVEIMFKGFEVEPCVSNSLVSAYAKCGSFVDAWAVFDKLLFQDAVAWSSMIKGYAVNQESDMAIECFQRMQSRGVKPDAVTFICLLTACSHASRVVEGQDYFNAMENSYAIVPTLEHFSCMVDLLSRSGYLYEAENLLEMLSPPPEAMWLALLSACKLHREEDVGLRCFQQLVKLNPEDATWYVIMSDIYASNGKWDDVTRVEEMKRLARAEKKSAVALLELNSQVHEFVIGSGQHTACLAGRNNLWGRIRAEGHVPDVDLSRIQFM